MASFSHLSRLARLLLVTATLAMIVVTAALAGPGPRLSRSVPSRATVVIRNFAFAPARITVSRGAVIRFVNRDSANHSVTADRGAFDLSNLQPGQAGTIRLRRTGSFSYHCTFHPFMHGVITVR